MFRDRSCSFTMAADRRAVAALGAPYGDQLTVSGGVGPTWSLVEGALPPGLSLSAAGVLAGVPETAGTFTFVGRAVAGPLEATRAFNLVVGEPQLDTETVIEHLLRSTGLGEHHARYLDLAGNRNGRLDVGDVLLWLKRDIPIGNHRTGGNQ